MPFYVQHGPAVIQSRCPSSLPSTPCSLSYTSSSLLLCLAASMLCSKRACTAHWLSVAAATPLKTQSSSGTAVPNHPHTHARRIYTCPPTLQLEVVEPARPARPRRPRIAASPGQPLGAAES